jgi:phosphoserine aminotransferase
MRKKYFTPGPSELYPTVYKHIRESLKLQIGSISHRSAQFQEIYHELTIGLKKLLSIPDDYYIFVVGSGTEAMERTIQNCVEKHSLHFVNGSFSKRFFIIAQELSKKPVSVEVSIGQGFNFKEITIPKSTELLCFTQNETSSGVMAPVSEIHKIAKKHQDMLVAVDIVSSVPYVDLDYTLLDIVFFSVQKGFGLPAGLGIMVVSPRAIKKSEDLQKKITIGSYHSFFKMLHYAQKQQTHETPPVLEMYLIEKVVKDMLRKGIDTIRRETDQKASLLYEFLDQSDTLPVFVKEKQWRSKTVIVADIQKAKRDVKKFLAEKGFIVGGGYGENKNTQIRIANFPAHSLRDVERLIKQLQMISRIRSAYTFS